MSKISVDVSSARIPVLQVGYQGENEVTDVLFDLSSWITEFGEGVAQLRVKRPGNSEDESYVLSLTITDGKAVWTVSETDTANKGNGKVQLSYLVGNIVKKAVIYPYKVGKSIVGADNPVDPFDSWIERSKAWAIGETLDGDNVPETDETYQNNAKYYAEQADILGSAQVVLAAEKVTLAAEQVTLATEKADAAAASEAAVNGVSTQLTTRMSAIETEQAVQDARMDTFTSLPEGSTSGNAELADIRVGADGTTYDTAGNAVRGQIGELKSDLDNIVDKKNLFSTKVDGYFVNQENGIFDAHEQYYRSDFIRVIGGETYTFSNEAKYYSGFRLFCYDSSKNPITGSGHYREQTITTPSNASYIVFSDYIDYFSKVQFEKGSTPTEYSEGGKIKYSSIPIIEPDKCSFFEEENNAYKIPQEYIKQNIKLFDVNLPSKLYALVGEELNVYFDNIVDGYDSEYDFDVECAVGQNLGYCYRIEPTSEGTVDLKIAVSKDGYTVEKNCTIYVASTNARSGVNKKVLVMGDSTTAHGNVIVHLNDNMSNDVMDITTVGTQGESPNNHEGRSGWKYDTYFKEKDGSVVNPFYNPSTGTFDAQYYFTNNPSVPIPDYWFIHLGINDMFEMTGTLIPWKINKVIGQMNTVISSIKSVNTNIKVCICLTIPPSYTQDAFGRAYKCSFTRNEQKHSVFEYVKRLITEFENRETDGIFIVPYHVNLDTRHNMVSLETKYNKRNDRKEVMTTGGGAIHPADSGYWQMADTLWFFLKNDN